MKKLEGNSIEMSSSGRNNTITYLKALGIILMVLGHSYCSIPYIVGFLYMFHMPLFFFTSGFCFKTIHLNNFRIFAWKRIKGLYWPFVKYGLVFVLLHNYLFRLNIYNDQFGYLGAVSHLYSTAEIIESIQETFNMQHIERLLGGFWFLSTLFWASLIAWIALKMCKNIIAVAICLFVICLIMNKMVWFVPFLKISSREFAVAFLFVIGYLFAQFKFPRFPLYVVIFSLLLTFIGSLFWRIAMDEMPCSNKVFPLYILTAILATWSFYSMFYNWKETSSLFSKLMIFVGTHTLEILTWHFFSFKLTSLLIIFIYNLPIVQLASFPIIQVFAAKGWWVVYLVSGVAIPLALTYFTNNIKLYAKSKIHIPSSRI